VQALNNAVIGEAGPLEPTNFTASLIDEIDRHTCEGLYASIQSRCRPQHFRRPRPTARAI